MLVFFLPFLKPASQHKDRIPDNYKVRRVRVGPKFELGQVCGGNDTNPWIDYLGWIIYSSPDY